MGKKSQALARGLSQIMQDHRMEKDENGQQLQVSKIPLKFTTSLLLPILDSAVLVISGTDGVQAHTETLWRLLRRLVAFRVALPVYLLPLFRGSVC